MRTAPRWTARSPRRRQASLPRPEPPFAPLLLVALGVVACPAAERSASPPVVAVGSLPPPPAEPPLPIARGRIGRTDLGLTIPSGWLGAPGEPLAGAAACLVEEVVEIGGEGGARRRVTAELSDALGDEVGRRLQAWSEAEEGVTYEPADQSVVVAQPSARGVALFRTSALAGIPPEPRRWLDRAVGSLPQTLLRARYAVTAHGEEAVELDHAGALRDAAEALTAAGFDRLRSGFERRLDRWTVSVQGVDGERARVRVSVVRDPEPGREISHCYPGIDGDFDWGDDDDDDDDDI